MWVLGFCNSNELQLALPMSQWCVRFDFGERSNRKRRGGGGKGEGCSSKSCHVDDRVNHGVLSTLLNLGVVLILPKDSGKEKSGGEWRVCDSLEDDTEFMAYTLASSVVRNVPTNMD